MRESLRDLLKRQTAREHSDLEAALAQRRFFESLHGYIDYLERAWSFQLEAEEMLNESRAERVVADWPERRRAFLAQRDLATLTARSQEAPHNLPSSRDNLCCLSPGRPGHILGVMYVLEGSTLGGALLLKAVSGLGVSPRHGGSFLASYGADRGRMWQRFLQTLALWDERGTRREDVVQAARATFNAARAHLLERPPLSLNESEPRRSSL